VLCWPIYSVVSHHELHVTTQEYNDLDFFAGGVPAGAIFQLAAKEIKNLLDAKPKNPIGHTLEEVCFIGLVSYFEAFCRDCFASLINISPELIQRLKSRGYDISVDSLSVLEMHDRLPYQIGFLISERYDFGTARKVNALYSALMGITPFSKKDAKTYDGVLSDRNLLVHHGGIYTTSYFRQHIDTPSDKTRIFMDSLIVDKEYVEERFAFLYGMAEKIVKKSSNVLAEDIASKTITIQGTAEKALKMFSWWD